MYIVADETAAFGAAIIAIGVAASRAAIGVAAMAAPYGVWDEADEAIEVKRLVSRGNRPACLRSRASCEPSVRSGLTQNIASKPAREQGKGE